MDRVAQELFADFPRRVGTPNQHWVFNEAQVELFLDVVDGVRGAYTTLNRLPIVEGQPDVSDKVFFDFDSPAKDEVEGNGKRWDHPDIDPNEPADELIRRMRNDAGLATDVIGQPVEDARRLAQESASDNIPVLGVFTGFGVHVHQLYQETVDPRDAMASVAARYEDKADLETMDWECVGQPEKLCRLPNVERATYVEGQHGERRDGRGTGLYTVPLDGADLRTITAKDLLALAEGPRDTGHLEIPEERPQMPVWEEYIPDGTAGDDIAQRPVDQRTQPVGTEMFDDMETILRELFQMPCMVERIQQPNPGNRVRLNAAVMLFNAGLNPQQVENLFGQLGWVDFDREITRSKLDHAWKTGYSDMSCSSLRSRGLCVKEDPKECHTYGWSGGQVEW